MKSRREQLQEVRQRLSQTYKRLQQLEQRLPRIKNQVEVHSNNLTNSVFQIEEDKKIVTPISEASTNLVNAEDFAKIQSDLEKLRQETLVTLQEGKRNYNTVSVKLEEQAIALKRLVEQLENDRLEQKNADIKNTIYTLRSQLEKLRQDAIINGQEIKKQIQDYYQISESQLRERLSNLEELMAQLGSDRSTVDQDIEAGRNITLQVQSKLEQLHHDTILKVQQVEGRIQEQYHLFENQWQKNAVTLEGIVAQVTLDKTNVSQLVQDTQERINSLLDVQSYLEQLRESTIVNLQETQREIEKRYQELETHIEERWEVLDQLNSQLAENQTVPNWMQETEERTRLLLNLPSQLEELQQNIVFNLQEIEKRVQEQYRNFATQFQENSHTLAETAAQIASDKAAASQLLQITEERINQISQIPFQLDEIRQEIVSNRQNTEQQIEQLHQLFERQLEERWQKVEERVSQETSDSETVSQLTRQSQEITASIQQIQAELEELRQSVSSGIREEAEIEYLEQLRQDSQTIRTTLIEIQRSSEEFKQEAEQKLQALHQETTQAEDLLTLTQERVEEVNQQITSAQEQFMQRAIAQVEQAQHALQLRQDQILKEEQVSSRLSSLVEETLTVLGGETGLETLRQEFLNSRDVLQEIKSYRQQLQSDSQAVLQTLQEQLDAHLETKQAVSKIEQMRSEVSSLAQQVRADMEVVESVRSESKNSRAIEASNLNAIDSSMRELRGVLDRLQSQIHEGQEQLGQKLEITEKKWLHSRNWLWGLTFFCAGIALALIIALFT